MSDEGYEQTPPTERRVADGTSKDGFSAAMHDAIEKKVGKDERPGLRFNVTDSWVETIEHHSPWHVTYNVKIAKAPDSAG
jgi:hypothetical protein